MEKFVPNSNYKDKYAHLIGQDAALEAARKTETNKAYGFGKSFRIFIKCSFETNLSNAVDWKISLCNFFCI